VTHRILHIFGSLEVDGAAKQLTYLAKKLPPADFDTHVIALRASQGAVELMRRAGIAPVVIGWRGTLDAVAFWRAKRQIERWKSDLVHLWSLQRGRYFVLGTTRAAGVKTSVVSVRSVKDWMSDRLPVRARSFERRTDKFVVNGTTIRRHCLATGMDADKLTTISDGVCPVEESPMSRQELLAELQLPADAKLIAYIGSLTPEKRLKELIWAIDQLKAVGTAAYLMIIGDGSLRNALERYSRLNRVEDRVRFLGFRRDVPRLLPNIDVVWHAGACEGQSNAILEAMCAEIPVVAADAGGSRELVVAGETGYLVPVGERAGFARCTLPLLENSELAARLGAEGGRRALQFHQVDHMVTQYAELYRRLLE
jgi:glycosyltransferase involved in cell wall biosynthesis